MKKLNLIGKHFGMLTVVGEFPHKKLMGTRWICQCNCGKKTIVQRGNLLNGHTTSCGCRRVKHSMSYTEIYGIWNAMIQRCNNPNDQAYKNYGKRGIKVCSRWLDPRKFHEDMGDRPKNRTLDRRNNNGNYEPSNCRWVTWREQASNKRDGKNRKWFIATNQSCQILSNNQEGFARLWNFKSASNISNCLNGRRKTSYGWTFRLAES